MNRWIDADERITIQLYDDEHEEWREEDMTIAELLDQYTDEGCPSTKQEWVQCSERLPKKDGRYQVTRHDDVTNTEFTDILWYEKGLWWNRQSIGDYAVIAWMPLPKPWKGTAE